MSETMLVCVRYRERGLAWVCVQPVCFCPTAVLTFTENFEARLFIFGSRLDAGWLLINYWYEAPAGRLVASGHIRLSARCEGWFHWNLPEHKQSVQAVFWLVDCLEPVAAWPVPGSRVGLELVPVTVGSHTCKAELSIRGWKQGQLTCWFTHAALNPTVWLGILTC